MSTIKTKYSLREIVWYLFDNKIQHGRICNIVIISKVAYYNLSEEAFMKDPDNDSLCIKYEIRPFRISSGTEYLSSDTHTFNEVNLFKTKQLLMKSL